MNLPKTQQLKFLISFGANMYLKLEMQQSKEHLFFSLSSFQRGNFLCADLFVSVNGAKLHLLEVASPSGVQVVPETSAEVLCPLAETWRGA